MTLDINKLNSQDTDFEQQLSELLDRDATTDASINNAVVNIIQQIRDHGDSAVLDYTRKFDRLDVDSIAKLEVNEQRLQKALEAIGPEKRKALQRAANRIQTYHERQKQDSWSFQESDGSVLGQKVTPLDRVGLYVPGGKASYPSSVLMNAIPAKVAGVPEVIMVVPAPDGEINDMVLAAADIAGVDKVITIGGAQAVAALAYGTESIPRVDKIVGPGNAYVATAKRLVFGQVGIDMIAGPSEILVVCDGGTDPDWVAMDLCSQAEHDEHAQAILISPDGDFLQRVEQSLQKVLPSLERAEIAQQSLQHRGALIQVKNLDQAMELVNRIAPEHLELSLEDAMAWVDKVRHAGAIFLGRYTSEALGDYCAGPNHVLPTSGTARYSSPLGVYDFQKRSSIIYCTQEKASELGKIASIIGHGEGLSAHAKAAEFRIKPDQ